MGSGDLLGVVTQKLPVLEWIGGWGFDFPAYDSTLEEIATGTSSLYLTLYVAVVRRTLSCSRIPK